MLLHRNPGPIFQRSRGNLQCAIRGTKISPPLYYSPSHGLIKLICRLVDRSRHLIQLVTCINTDSSVRCIVDMLNILTSVMQNASYKNFYICSCFCSLHFAAHLSFISTFVSRRPPFLCLFIHLPTLSRHTHTFASLKLRWRCKEHCLAALAGRCLSHGQPDRLRLNLPI